MTVANILDGCLGWGLGQGSAMAMDKEEEVKQGGNYVMSSIVQTSQLFLLAEFISIIAIRTLKGTANIIVQVGCNVIPFVLAPIVIAAGCVKNDQYKNFQAGWSGIKGFDFKGWHIFKWLPTFPAQLSDRTVKVAHFAADHLGSCVRVAIVASACGLIALGHQFLGGSALVALAYQIVDSKGYVPRKVSLFVERYIPIVALVGTIAGSTTLVSRVFSTLLLPTYLSTKVSDFIFKKYDLLCRKIFPSIQGPSIEQFEAPLVQNKTMTLNQMEEVFNAETVEFELNPAHCSKWTRDSSKLPHTQDWNKLLQLFDKISDADWEKSSKMIPRKLCDDDRFIQFLKKRDPAISKEDFQYIADEKNKGKHLEPRKNIEEIITKLAQEKSQTNAVFMKQWLREQMVNLVDTFHGKIRAKGSQRDLVDGMKAAEIVIPHLEKLDLQEKYEKIELFDSVLKICIESGEYCARGVKQTFATMTGAVLRKASKIVSKTDLDPIAEYELKVNGSLEELRNRINQEYYSQFVKQLKIPEGMAHDVHTLDVYRFYLSYGFLPVTEFEKEIIGISEISLWELYSEHRQIMSNYYLNGNVYIPDRSGKFINEAGQKCRQESMMGQAFDEHGGNNAFYEYTRAIVNANPLLSTDEKEKFIEKWEQHEDATERLKRLALVWMGVLNLKPSKVKPDSK